LNNAVKWITKIKSEKPFRVIMIIYMAIATMILTAGIMLSRTLPTQNVALILVSLVACEFLVEAVVPGFSSSWRGFFFWPAILVLARAGGRWFLRLRRKNWNYGVWLIVLASAVAALAQFCIAFPGANWSAALKLSAIRFGVSAFCLFWLSPWFISKLPQQPQDQAH
jgi:hypothetical protein